MCDPPCASEDGRSTPVPTSTIAATPVSPGFLRLALFKSSSVLPNARRSPAAAHDRMSGRLVQLVLPANGASAPFTHTVSFAAHSARVVAEGQVLQIDPDCRLATRLETKSRFVSFAVS